MITPPRIDLPAGVTVERWSIPGSERAVMRTAIADAREWAVFVPGFTGSKEDFIAVQIPGAGHSPNADGPHALVEYLLAAWGR
ncbi:MAG: hypothetical protein ACYC2Z_01075 [Candidatus Nanopelagicales bacterium]